MTKRLALVTGGTTGIGAAVCKALIEAGYDIAANYNTNEERAIAFSKETGASIYQWDVSDCDACIKGVAQICTDFSKNIDILVNNAGITRDGMMHKMTFENWNAVITTNLMSCFNVTHAVINDMRHKGFGRIINISSVNAQLGQIGQTNYCASKAGIIGFTKALARESASKGITVNAIAPGYTDTNMVQGMPESALNAMIAQVPMGRLAHPSEIARAVVWVASDDAGFVTGQTLNINGGLYMQ
jgi:acetoacetyl-CoA reductase